MREDCLRCTRPVTQCVCELLRPFGTQTRVTIVQHVGERRHAFNTARLALAVLRDSRLVLARPRGDGMVAPRPALAHDAVLLFPSEGAPQASTWRPRPSEIVAIDGTWPQAKRVLRDNPWLQRLPCMALDVSSPSRYRIRSEPAPHCLSTIESLSLALHALEPENPDLPRMLDGFDAMIDRHLATAAPSTQRFHRRTRPTVRSRLEDWENVVMAYGERRNNTWVQWTAVKPATGELREWRGAIDLSWFEGSHCFAWRAGGPSGLEVRSLKELYKREPGAGGTLDEIVAELGLPVERLPVAGRAGLRLGMAVAMGRHLTSVRRSAHDPPQPQ